MANSLSTNPIILDTAGATSAIATGLKIKTIVWSHITTDADDLDIHTKASGDIVFTGTGLKSQNVVIYFGEKGQNFPGLYLTTLDSGIVHVYTC